MTCTLWLLRHAKSAWDTPAPTDFERPLAKRGRRDAPRIGQWLSEQAGAIDAVVCSTALRAQQTLAGVLQHWQVDEERIEFSDQLYHAGVRALMQVFRAAPTDYQALMLVGHNPGLDALLEQLCGHDLPYSDSGKLMTTAALAQIELADWQADSGRLVALIRPRELD